MAASVEVSEPISRGLPVHPGSCQVTYPIRNSVVKIYSWLCVMSQQVVSVLQNEFVGATNQYWECALNWLTEDDSPAEHAPCGDDRAFFDTVCPQLRRVGLSNHPVFVMCRSPHTHS